MAAIFTRTKKDGTKSYFVQIRRRGQPTIRKSFARKTDAERWARRIEAELDRGKAGPTQEAQRRTFGEMVDRYMREIVPTMALSSRHNRNGHLRWWKAKLGDRRLVDVTPAVLNDAVATLKAEPARRGGTRAPSTINRHIASISHAYTVACKQWQWLDANPCRNVRKEREPQGRVRFLDEHERAALLEACKADRQRALYPIVVLGLATGMRQSEITHLKWQDIDLERGVILLHKTKNRQRRALPLTGFARDVLLDWARVRRIDTDLVFPGKQRVTGARPIHIHHAWIRAVKAAGLADCRFHDLRHTTASYLAMGGATVAEIAAVLGHRTLAMVQRYAHLSEPHTLGVVARMNAELFGGDSDPAADTGD